MRKKIKELMNKEEGFTLVELLAVIVILGIIVAIAIPAIGNVTSTATTNAAAAEKELVVDAARLYILNNDNKVPTGDKVDVATLREEGYLETTTSENIKEDDYVKITKLASGNFEYEFNGKIDPDE